MTLYGESAEGKGPGCGVNRQFHELRQLWKRLCVRSPTPCDTRHTHL
jgi:hypothetical protein